MLGHRTASEVDAFLKGVGRLFGIQDRTSPGFVSDSFDSGTRSAYVRIQEAVLETGAQEVTARLKGGVPCSLDEGLFEKPAKT